MSSLSNLLRSDLRDADTAGMTVSSIHPQWSRAAAIYQLNTRQFSAEGTLRAAQAELSRIRDLGVGIVWLMPVHPIGFERRKGSLGSPYAVYDYFAVSPELGTLEDLRAFVAAAHELGMYVILDWVANHTAWDNPLVAEHPDWYDRDHAGGLRSTPWWDWDDIIDLDYGNDELRRYMISAMAFWVRDLDIDGFRCDTAGFVPTDFWEQARAALDEIKPVFMLAEWEARDLHHRAFDASYAWSWNEALHRLATGKADLTGLRVYYSWNEKAYPRDAMRLTFVSNHDKNAWEGTEFEQFGPALEAAIVLSVVSEGIPMIYNGQEAGSDRRLAFFERDPIVWGEHPLGDLYRRLFTLKRQTRALWNGHWGARMIELPSDASAHVLSFVRQNEDERVVCAFNLSDGAAEVELSSDLLPGTYRDFATGDQVELGERATLAMRPWSYRVLLLR